PAPSEMTLVAAPRRAPGRPPPPGGRRGRAPIGAPPARSESQSGATVSSPRRDGAAGAVPLAVAQGDVGGLLHRGAVVRPTGPAGDGGVGDHGVTVRCRRLRCG